VGVTLRESLAEASKSIAAVKRVVGNDVKVYAGGAAVHSHSHAHALGADEWASDPRMLLAQLAGEPVG
jgi:hypothetical protein